MLLKIKEITTKNYSLKKKVDSEGNSQRYRISKLLEENITRTGSTGKSISNIVSLAHVKTLSHSLSNIRGEIGCNNHIYFISRLKKNLHLTIKK